MEDNIFGTLLKRASYASTGTLIARISAAITGIIIARTVGPASFGVYAAIWALILLSSSFTEIGMITGLKRIGARFPGSLPSLMGNTLITKVMIGICALIIAYFSCSVVTKSAKASMLFLPLALAGFSTVCTEPFFAALQVKGQQKLVSFLMMGRGLFFLIGIGILAVFEFDIVALAWYQGLLYFVALIIVFFMVIPIVSISTDFSRILSQIKGSFVFGISALLYSIYSQIPLLFLSHFRPEEEVGYFAVGLRFVTLSLLVGAAASNDAFLPSLFDLYKTNREKFRQVCESMQKLFVPLGIFMACALYVCSDALIIILQGEEYRPAVGILRIVCWMTVINYGVLAAGAALTAGDRIWVKVAFQTVVTLIALVVGLAIIGNYGVIGASYVMIIIWVCIMFLYIPYAHRKKLIGFSGLGSLFAPAGLTILLAVLIVHLIPDHNLLSITIFFFGSLVLWQPTAIKVLKNSALKPHAEKL